MSSTAEAAFFCVADSRYFLGAVGTINSLRLLGHVEPIHLLDAGLTAEQRDLLAPEVELEQPPADAPPWLQKTQLPLSHSAQTIVLIDTDIVVTRHLGELISRAAASAVVAFENSIDRFDPAWERLLGLGPLRRGPYLCTAIVAIGRSPGEEVVSLMEEHQELVDFERTWWRRNEPGYPFLYADQDVFNAIVAARVPAERVESLPSRLAPIPPFEGLEVRDAGALRCAYADGTEPYVVHHYVTKPWLEPTYHGVYSQLLHRLLVGSDVAIRVPRESLPLRFRSGPFAFAERKRINLGQRLRWTLDRS
ncbi:MAG: hypothetical protein ACR2OC_10215 [Solirubrobacterales bacterium]